MTIHNSDQPQTKRRWFQFSLRTLLEAMLLATLPMAWVGKLWREHEAEQRAVEAILKLGGSVYYQVPGEEGFLFFRAGTKLPWRGHVDAVDLSDRNVDDAGMVHLNGLTQLQWLYINGSQVSDAGLVHLQGLTQLQEIFLFNTQISDAGLVHLQGLTQLQSLALNNTQISDAGLVHLQGLTQLQSLLLQDTKISDAGLVHLKGLTQLQGVYLEDTKISDVGAAELQKALPRCQIQR